MELARLTEKTLQQEHRKLFAALYRQGGPLQRSRSRSRSRRRCASCCAACC